jgi:hypothetical protein
LIKKEREKKKNIAFAFPKSCFFFSPSQLLEEREKRDPKIESDPREKSKTARETASRNRKREKALCAK